MSEAPFLALPGFCIYWNGFSIVWFNFPIEFFFKNTKNGSIFTCLSLGDVWIEIASISTTRTERHGTKWGNFTISFRTLFNATTYCNKD
jgi:hypothetical protein